MKKIMFVLAVSVGMCSSAMALTCPAGQHAAYPPGCVRICTQQCVPDTCSFGNQLNVPLGGTIVSFTMSPVYYPDVCSNYEVYSTCVGQNKLSPPPAPHANCVQEFPEE